ncbi:MAG TPA: class I SAM-dependent methyltransferase [Opitutaceae bacterium]|nr:class I SAM-dependent methyltransferase [Opitutaceae bacterium]
MSERRTAYVASAPPEAFIVPLVAAEVGEWLERLPANARGASRALDVGCGGQPFREQVERAGYRYFGMDLPQAKSPRVDFFGALDRELSPELRAAPPFDLILCTEVLEHVADWETAFANLARLLAPGGAVVITAPHFYLGHEEPFDFWRPTPHAFAHFARRHGLQVAHQKTAGDVWSVLGTLISVGGISARRRSPRVRLQVRVLNALLRALRRALARGQLQRDCEWQTPFYLSNVVVLRKSPVA